MSILSSIQKACFNLFRLKQAYETGQHTHARAYNHKIFYICLHNPCNINNIESRALVTIEDITYDMSLTLGVPWGPKLWGHLRENGTIHSRTRKRDKFTVQTPSTHRYKQLTFQAVLWISKKRSRKEQADAASGNRDR